VLALGFIETKGRIGAIEAADAALKAANVRLITIRKVSGGLVTVIIEGEVAAVKASIEAAEIKTKQLRYGVTTNVIPGPAEKIKSFIKNITKEKSTKIGIKKTKTSKRKSKKTKTAI
jgi:microcompartment protein CcmL/EutN